MPYYFNMSTLTYVLLNSLSLLSHKCHCIMQHILQLELIMVCMRGLFGFSRPHNKRGPGSWQTVQPHETRRPHMFLLCRGMISFKRPLWIRSLEDMTCHHLPMISVDLSYSLAVVINVGCHRQPVMASCSNGENELFLSEWPLTIWGRVTIAG